MSDDWNPKWMSLLTHCSLIADTTFDHMLVDFTLHTNKRLTHSAADYRSTAALRRAQRGVWWRILSQHRRGRSWRERWEIWDGERTGERMLAHGRERKRGKKEKDDRTAFNSFLSNIINPLLHELSNHCFKKNDLDIKWTSLLIILS